MDMIEWEKLFHLTGLEASHAVPVGSRLFQIYLFVLYESWPEMKGMVIWYQHSILAIRG